MLVYLSLSNSGISDIIRIEKNLNSYVLMSYFYFKDFDVSIFPNKIIDSGAFTLFSQNKSKIDFDKYTEEYAEFINKYNIEYFFELDIDVLIGLEEVERLRTKLEKLTRKKCIPVWHVSRGVKKFEEMCNQYKYIAIGGIVSKEITDYSLLEKLVNYANKRNVKVHGLGFTKQKWLKKIKFYSVDSITWFGARFYKFFKFKENKIITIPIQGFRKGSRTKLILSNYSEWSKFQSYAKLKL